MKIIRRRQRITKTHYLYSYGYENNPGSGFSFDCDENGNIDENKLNPEARENLKKCRSGFFNGVKMINIGVRIFTHTYTKPKLGLCKCGTEVTLSGFTNTCHVCNTDYNMSGQELAPREQWGEETGESLSDILNI